MPRETLTHAPTSILIGWLAQAQPGTDAEVAFRRELDRRVGERDEQIGERKAAEILGIDRETMRRVGDSRLIRPICELGFEYRFSRREIERWAAWTDREGSANA